MSDIIWHGDKLLELAPQITSEDDRRSIHYHFDSAAYELPEAKIIIDSDNYRDFFYDRATQSVMFNVIAHPVYIGQVEAFYQACVDRAGSIYDFREYTTEYSNKNCERYLKKGRGFYLSSVADRIYVAKDFKLTAREKIVFRSFEFIKEY